MSKVLLVKCPICKTLVERENDYFPFCSDRCKTNDLGNWASGAYAIPEPSSHDFDDEDNPSIH